jgi:hypothetical protein
VAREGGEATVEIRDCKVAELVPIVRHAQHLGVRRLEVQRARVSARNTIQPHLSPAAVAGERERAAAVPSVAFLLVSG